jgi:hypothetical protein
VAALPPQASGLGVLLLLLPSHSEEEEEEGALWEQQQLEEEVVVGALHLEITQLLPVLVQLLAWDKGWVAEKLAPRKAEVGRISRSCELRSNRLSRLVRHDLLRAFLNSCTSKLLIERSGICRDSVVLFLE